MSYILAFDSGTTSVRAILFDREGRIRSAAQKEIRQIFPKPGWVEQDPREIWFSQISVAVEALGRARIRPSDVAGVGITNQRETTIIWDRKTGDAVYNAIVWQDRRTAQACDKLRAAGHDRQVRNRTGLLLDAYFSGDKDRLDSRQRAGRARAGRGGRSPLRHGRHLADLETDQRPQRPRDRPEQRLAHAALQHSHRRVGPGPAQALQHPRRPAARGPHIERSLRRNQHLARLAKDAHRGHRGRPAGRSLRPDVRASRPGQEHLRHRLLPPAKSRLQTDHLDATAC